MKSKSSRITPSLSADIKKAFDILDTEGKGFLEVGDVKVALRALGCEPKKDEAKYIISELDKKEKDPLRNARIVNGTFHNTNIVYL